MVSSAGASARDGGRNGLLDHARLVAAFGIVFFHVHAPGGSFGYAALPFFTMALIVSTAPAAATSGFAPYAARRARRLLLPWLAWSAVFGAVKIAEAVVEDQPLHTEFEPWMLLAGTAWHLWFLPFAFVCSLAVYPVVPVGLRHGMSEPLLICLFWIMFGTFAVSHLAELPVPLEQWLFALPGALAGLVFSMARGQAARLLCAAVIVVAAATLASGAGYSEGALQQVIAATVLLGCLAIRLPETPLSRWAADASWSVYLVHPLVASVLMRATPMDDHGLPFAVAICIGSLILGSAASRAGAWLQVQTGRLGWMRRRTRISVP